MTVSSAYLGGHWATLGTFSGLGLLPLRGVRGGVLVPGVVDTWVTIHPGTGAQQQSGLFLDTDTWHVSTAGLSPALQFLPSAPWNVRLFLHRGDCTSLSTSSALQVPLGSKHLSGCSPVGRTAGKAGLT